MTTKKTTEQIKKSLKSENKKSLKGGEPSDIPIHGNVLFEQGFS